MTDNHFNRYGLVDGYIPAGMSCPWVKQCGLAIEICPGFKNKLLPNRFSCGAARLFSASNHPPDNES